MDSAAPASVVDQVRERMDQFTASERKVARTLLASYPAAGLESAADLAKKSRVSTPTVLRFVTRLGFQGYPEFQKMLIREVHDQLGSPLAQIRQYPVTPEGPEFLPYASTTFLTAVKESFDNLPRRDFLRAVELLADQRRRVRLAGGRFSHVMAEYLTAHLQMIRPDVACLRPGDMSQAASILDGGRRDVLVVFDYRRYQADTIKLALTAAPTGTTVILMTDPYLSPIADVADVVLPARVDAPSPFDSLVAAMALVESLAAAVFTACGTSAYRRVQRLEALNIGAGWRPVDPTP